MTAALELPLDLPPAPIPLRLPGDWELTDDLLLQLSSLNEVWFFEADASGALLIAPGSTLRGSTRGVEFIAQLVLWSDTGIGGAVLGGRGLLRLPDGSRRIPRVAWISEERLAQIPLEDAERVWPVVPDFVVEIRPYHGQIDYLHEKMSVWMATGARLGWLIDPFKEQVHIYRPDAEVEVLERPSELGDEGVLPGLSVDLERVWG